MIFTIKNDKLTVQISDLGAELQSIKTADGLEYLYDGSGVWHDRAPVLFPIIGRLVNQKYTYKGREYTQPCHGFGKVSTFTVKAQTADSVTFLLTENPTTLENYPFNFEFTVDYRLNGDTIEVRFFVKNTNDGELLFSVGAHEGYRCPLVEGESFEDYSLLFENVENVDAWAIEGPTRRGDMYPFMRDTDTVNLQYSYFATDAVILSEHTSRAITFKSRKSGKGVEVKFPGFPTLGIWTKPGAPYICIEPWYGVCDIANHDGEFTRKEGIIRLEAGQTFDCIHTVRPF